MLRPEQVPLTLTQLSDRTWLPKFVAIVGWAELSRRAKTLVQQIKENPFLENVLREKYYVEMWIYIYRQWQLGRKRLPKIESNPDLFTAISFATMFAAVYEHLDGPARNKLRGQVLDGLRTGKGLLPLQHEISTVVHLLRKGYPVTFSDLTTSKGGYDFLVDVAGVEVEAECKNVGADIGRKVTSEDLIAFGPKLKRLWPAFAPGRNTLRLVQLKVPDRFGRNDDDHARHLAAIERRLQRTNQIESASSAVDVSDFAVPPEIIPATESNQSFDSLFRTFLDQCIGTPNLNSLIMFERAKGFLAVTVTSEKENSLIENIEQQLLESAKTQLSGTRPAWIFVRLTAMSPDGIARLKEREDPIGGHGLQRIATHLFDRRPHVHSVVFVPGRMVLTDRFSPIIGARGLTESSAPAYIFRNSEHSLANDARLKL